MPEPIAWEWKIAAASVQGVSHVKAGLPCQDVYRCQHLPHHREAGLSTSAAGTTTLIAVVADGAGSAPFGEEGAKLAGDTALLCCSSPKTNPTARDLEIELRVAAEMAQQRIAQAAGEQNGAVRDWATTLIVLLASAHWAACLQIGDGASVILDGEGNYHALTVPPADAEYANETTFLTSPHALETAQFRYWQGDVAGVAMFTDGLQRLALKLPEGTPHTPFFAPLFRFLRETEGGQATSDQLADFLRSPRITERADDDLTLLLATRSR